MVLIMSQLKFNQDTHTYFLNDTKIPSVSEVLRPLSNQEYEGISESILDNAKERGTEIHKAIELFLKYKFANIREEYKGYFEAFKKWHKDFSREYEIIQIESEYRTYHKIFLYAGTIDMIVTAKHKETNEIFNFVVDNKTTANLNLKYVAVQTSAYQQAIQSHKQIKIDYRYVLHLKKDGEYSFVKLEDKFNIFIACYTIINYLK